MCFITSLHMLRVFLSVSQVTPTLPAALNDGVELSRGQFSIDSVHNSVASHVFYSSGRSASQYDFIVLLNDNTCILSAPVLVAFSGYFYKP